MISIAALLKVIPVFLVVLIVPGPDFFTVLSTSLARGQGAGLKAAAGITFTNGLFMLVCIEGLAVAFEHYPWMVMAIKIAGGLFLAYLSLSLWRASFRKPEAVVMLDHNKQSPFARGVLTTLTNPKAIAFYTSIFALVLTPQTTGATKAVISLIMLALVFFWFALVAFSLSRPRVRAHYLEKQWLLDRIAGTVMGFFAVELLISG